ncbi:hypothetical protein PHYBOEH_008122 [Phytophthora boehmeriae]|uniref:Uncharacterized protein n=1 Tax=Phytophthora boehmeriae TaxID=109152 RepID=A0A8T1W348_9STRA|nr:hypothetical protein PHYBOEH_008122 [Phytophthora boehmeriae]
MSLLQELYDSNMGKYCKPGEKKGMHLVEFLILLEKNQIFSDSFRVRDAKDPFLACKLVVLDEMTTIGHKKLFLTDFMEIILRVSALRYPPRSLTVVEVVRSLQQLLTNHFYKQDTVMGQFCDTVDQAVAKDRLEAFANAINAQRIHPQAAPTALSRNRGGGQSAGSAQASTITEESASEAEDDSEAEADGGDKLSVKTAETGDVPVAASFPLDDRESTGMQDFPEPSTWTVDEVPAQQNNSETHTE